METKELKERILRNWKNIPDVEWFQLYNEFMKLDLQERKAFQDTLAGNILTQTVAILKNIQEHANDENWSITQRAGQKAFLKKQKK